MQISMPAETRVGDIRVAFMPETTGTRRLSRHRPAGQSIAAAPGRPAS